MSDILPDGLAVTRTVVNDYVPGWPLGSFTYPLLFLTDQQLDVQKFLADESLKDIEYLKGVLQPYVKDVDRIKIRAPDAITLEIYYEEIGKNSRVFVVYQTTKLYRKNKE